jgi:gliding motility-associated-like protein
VRKWATYYGADDEDDGSYACSDGYNVFIAGDAETDADYPAVNPGGGAYYQALPSGLETVWIGKFIIGGKLSTGPGTSICRGDSTQLSASGAVSYRWKPAKGLSDTNTANPYAKPKFTTTYTVTGIDTGGCAGTYKDSVTVVVDTLRPFISNDTTICSGSSIILKASGGTNYNWNKGSTSSSISIVGDSASATYTVKITNGVCQKDTSVKVTVVPLPKPVIAGTLSKCFGLTDTLLVSSSVNPTTYKWANGSTSTSVITGNLLHDTIIYVTAYNNLGCPVKDSFKVNVNLPPAVSLNAPTVACSGNEVLLKATTKGAGPFSYMWTPGGKTTDTITVNPGILTSYSVRVSNGCDTTATTWVLPDNPTLEACCDHIIFAGDDTVLVAHSPGARTYKWTPQVTCLNPPCDSVKVSPQATTTYTVTSTDSAGCQVERIITIIVETPCDSFIIPNVFTPNYPGALGVNNVFYINGSGITGWDITIYDRWGKEMFSSINPAQYWDGNTEGGGKAPDGVYYYIINVTCQNNTFKKDGFVQLIR